MATKAKAPAKAKARVVPAEETASGYARTENLSSLVTNLAKGKTEVRATASERAAAAALAQIPAPVVAVAPPKPKRKGRIVFLSRSEGGYYKLWDKQPTLSPHMEYHYSHNDIIGFCETEFHRVTGYRLKHKSCKKIRILIEEVE